MAFGWRHQLGIDSWHRARKHCRGVSSQCWPIRDILGGSVMSGGADKRRSYTTHDMGLPLSGSPLVICPYPFIPSDRCRPYSLWPTSLW